MAANASKVRFQMDTDASVTLRDIADGAETATAAEAGISLQELNHAYWHNNEIPHGVFLVGVHITELEAGDADETYVVSLQVDDTAAFSDSPVEIASYTLTGLSPDVYVFAVDSKMIPLLDPDNSGTDKWIRIVATLGGTTPSITYGAWIARNVYPG